MALSEDILKLKDVFNGANPLQAGMDQAGGTLQLPNVQDIQAPQVASPQPLMDTLGAQPFNPNVTPPLQNLGVPTQAPIQQLMTPEFLAQREADRGGPGIPNLPQPSFLGQVGQTARELFVAPMERLGQAAGEQKYGTGLSASGEAVGQPINPNTFAGQMATLPGTALNVAGLVTDPISAIPNLAGRAAEYFTGADIVSGGPVGAIPTPSRAAVDSVSDQAGAATIPTGAEGSPQANFAARMASEKPLSSAEIEQANALATSMGTTFNPATGYSRDPFLNAQGQTGGAPTSVENTQAEIQRRFGAPTVSGALSAPTGLGLRTDPQGRMIPAGFETRADAFSDFERQSALREQRAAEQFGVPRGPDSRDRDETGRISFEEARRRVPTERDTSGNITNRAEQRAAMVEPEQTGLTPYQAISASQRQQEIDMKKKEGMEAKEAKETVAFEEDTAQYQSITENASRLATLAQEAIGLTTEPGTTGIGGALLKHIPATNANQLKEVLAVVQSDVALQRLANLKATGATLGQISKPELDMLQNSFDALKQNLTGERLREALVRYTTNLSKVEAKIENAYTSKYKDRLANQAATQESGSIQSGSMQSGETTPSGRKVKIYQ